MITTSLILNDHAYEVGGDCCLCSRSYLYFSTARYLPLVSLFARSFDHSSPSPLEATQLAVSLVSESTSTCAHRRFLDLPPFQAKARFARFVPGGSPLIDHCINNNSTIIVIYHDVLPGTTLPHGLRGRHMERKVYLLISLCRSTYSILTFRVAQTLRKFPFCSKCEIPVEYFSGKRDTLGCPLSEGSTIKLSIGERILTTLTVRWLVNEYHTPRDS